MPTPHFRCPYVYPQRDFYWTTYPRTCVFNRAVYFYGAPTPSASIALRTSAVPSQPLLLSCRVPTHSGLLPLRVHLLCLRTRTSITPHTSTLGHFMHCVPSQFLSVYPAYLRTGTFSVLRTPALSQWMICVPWIRTQVTVLLCATDGQIHRSDLVPEISHFIGSLPTSLLYRSSF